MGINRISIVSVPVKDQKEAKKFYCGVLGFEVVRDNPMGPEQRWVQLSPSNTVTSITLVTWFEKMPPGCVQGMVLETDGIDESHALLKSKGLVITKIETAPWGRYATFQDPDGNGWVLQQSSADA